MKTGERKVYLGCIADDFTGAGDVASFLADAGLSVMLLNGIPEKQEMAEAEAQAYVIALKSRTAPVRAAVRDTLAAAEWLKNKGAEMLYLKYCSTFDSTGDGNIGPAADALLEKLHLSFTLLCPSLPVNGRKVRDGRLSVNGIPLHESSMRSHPLTPMKDDRLKELMQAQSRYPAFVVTEKELETGEKETFPEQLKEKISYWEKTYGHFYLIPDYFEDAHGEKIVELFGTLPLLTGGSGLMNALGARFLREDRGGTVPVPVKKPGGAVLLSGSCSEMTLKQVAAWQDSGGRSFRISPEKLLLEPENAAEEIFSFLEHSGGETVLYYSSQPAEKVREAQKAGAEKVSALLEKMTAELAVRALEKGMTRIIVAGGETSGAVTKALGFDSFYIGKSIAPGVPVMIPRSRPDMRLVLKSGNFGDEDFFRKALEVTER